MSLNITTELVKKLIAQQFPEWSNLPVYPVEKSGHDNRTFHLGDSMTIRLPSGQAYLAQVEKELQWLPKLRPHISLPIPSPIAKGQPTDDYPFPWLINTFIQGEIATYERIADLNKFAFDLAKFLKELQSIETINAPIAGQHNFYRGGDLAVYQAETEKALVELKDTLPTEQLRAIWNMTLSSKWFEKGVWVHGDIAPGNLLTEDGELSGVIDFGIMGVGDPSCDYAIAWTFFNSDSRSVFFETLGCDLNTIDRARGWALWKALITYHDKNIDVADNAKFTVNMILKEMESACQYMND